MSRAPMGRSKLRRSGNIESRIAQLEELQRPRDEILVVWRPPGAPVSKALRNGITAPEIALSVLFGRGAPPHPKRPGLACAEIKSQDE
jgi:hypothetical protein